MQTKFQNCLDIGLLILRLGVGATFMTHGVPKLQSGPEMWTQIGAAMGHFGVHFWPTVWGFIASASEGVGGFLMILGLFFRPALVFMFITMFVAATHHLASGDSIQVASNAIRAGVVFLSLIFTGPGKYTLVNLFMRRGDEKEPS